MKIRYCFLLFPFASCLLAEDPKPADAADEDVFEFHTEFNPITGENANFAGIVSPKIFVYTTAGLTGDDVDPSDLATAEHDPQNDFGVQLAEIHLDINVNDTITGIVSVIGGQGEGRDWNNELEEAYLHYHLNEWLAIGGGQFLSRFGFLGDRHLCDWEFVNQNLVNSRMLNEGELITQGGEVVLTPTKRSAFTIGAGGVRSHAHAHGEEEEGHGHGHGADGGEEHHLEADEVNFNDWVASAEWRQQLPNGIGTLSTSLATGENGFGRETWVYGVGLEKIWGAHDHGDGVDFCEFCQGAFGLRIEAMGRNVGIEDEDGERFDGDDYGFSTTIFYGLTDATRISLRHGWVSDFEDLELDDRHRISSALSTFLDEDQRIRVRFQYDFTTSDTIGDEHAGWLQLSLRWGGHAGAHHH